MLRIILAACATLGLLSANGAGAESLLSQTYAVAWVSPGFSPAASRAFILGDVRDETGRDTSFDLAAHFRDDLRGQLLQEGFAESARAGDLEAVRIDVGIRLFQEGGAFGRWVTSGAGAAYVVGYARLARAGRDPAAELIAVSVIAQGGLYSVGAEKTVLSDVAEKVVMLLKTGQVKNAEASPRLVFSTPPALSLQDSTPPRLTPHVRFQLPVHVADVKLASAAEVGGPPFEEVAGKFPFSKAESMADLRELVRGTLAAAGATHEPQAAGARYVLTPIVLGGMTIPFREAYAILFMRYELTGAAGEKAWSVNIYSQAKLDVSDTTGRPSTEKQTAYARLAAANLRQMADALSAWTATGNR